MKWLFLPLCLFLSNSVALDVYPAQPIGVRINLTDTPSEMATVTKTVASSGADYTTIAGALGWFQTNHDFDTDGIARIQITDTSTYTISSNLTLDGISGTPDIDGHLELTSNADDPFSGPTINCTHTSANCLTLGMDYIYIHNLYIENNNSSSSTEIFRVQDGVSNCLISKSALVALNKVSDQDGIFIGNGSISDLRIDNCVFLNWGRAGVLVYNASGAGAHSVDIRFCSFGTSIINGESLGGAIQRYATAGQTSNVTVYNSLGYVFDDSSHSSSVFDEKLGAVNGSFTGSNNIAEDASAEAQFTSSYDSVTFTGSGPVSGENAWLVDHDNTDETLVDMDIAGENAYTVTQNGINQVGSEPDARQDFSVDIMGNSRDGTTPDIGAFEYVSEVVGGSLPPKLHNLSHLLVR